MEKKKPRIEGKIVKVKEIEKHSKEIEKYRKDTIN